MEAKELRASARESLKGKWGTAALLTLIYIVVTYILSAILSIIPVIGPIIYGIISPALSFGILVFYIKISRGEEIKYLEFLKNGFPFLGKLWAIIFHVFLKMILPILLMIGSAILIPIFSSTSLEFSIFILLVVMIIYIIGAVLLIVKIFSFVLTSFILNDEPTLTAKEIVNKSEGLMKGNKLNYLYLELTFIGWAILSSLAFGLGYFWLLPYMQISIIKFYENLAGSANTTVETDYEHLS